MRITFVVVLFLSECLYVSGAEAHLAIDHLKQGVDARYKSVESSDTMRTEDKENALAQLKNMQLIVSQALSLSFIPSQKQQADEIVLQLNLDLQDFDKRIHEASPQ